MKLSSTAFMNGAAFLIIASASLLTAQSRDTVRTGWPLARDSDGVTATDRSLLTKWRNDSGPNAMRRVYLVSIDSLATGSQVRELLLREKAVVIGRYPLPFTYVVRVPDPGSRASDIDRVLAAFSASRIVTKVRVNAEIRGVRGPSARLPAADSLVAAYECGRIYVVTNRTGRDVSLSWTTEGRTRASTLVARGNRAEASGVSTYFVVDTVAPIHVARGGREVAKVANAGTPCRDLVARTAPDSLPAKYLASSRIVDKPDSLGIPVFKEILTVQFRRNASREERTAALRSVRGEVVGGLAPPPDGGTYYVRVPDDNTGAALKRAAAALRARPSIASAEPNYAIEGSLSAAPKRPER